jgi:hypothetical protein
MLLWSAAYHFVDACRAAWPFTTDDAFITLRYAQHWAGGDGITWNVGDAPVEGYSNFAYVALAAAALTLGLDAAALLKALGVVAALATAWLAYRIARRQVSPLLATVPGVVFLAFPGTVWWTVSGLETPVYVAVVLAAVLAFGRGVDPPHGGVGWLVVAGTLVAVAGVVRPEGPIVGVAFVVVLAAQVLTAAAAHRPRPRTGIGCCAIRSASPGPTRSW